MTEPNSEHATASGIALPRGLVIILAGLRTAAWLIAPTLLALVIVIGLFPIQRWLRLHVWPGWAATLALVLAVYGLLFGIALLMWSHWRN